MSVFDFTSSIRDFVEYRLKPWLIHRGLKRCTHDVVKRSACSWILMDDSMNIVERGHSADRFEECIDCGVAVRDGKALQFIKGGK